MRRGADLLNHRILALIRQEGWEEEVTLSGEVCQSICDSGPIVRIKDRRFTADELRDLGRLQDFIGQLLKE